MTRSISCLSRTVHHSTLRPHKPVIQRVPQFCPSYLLRRLPCGHVILLSCLQYWPLEVLLDRRPPSSSTPARSVVPSSRATVEWNKVLSETVWTWDEELGTRSISCRLHTFLWMLFPATAGDMARGIGAYMGDYTLILQDPIPYWRPLGQTRVSICILSRMMLHLTVSSGSR